MEREKILQKHLLYCTIALKFAKILNKNTHFWGKCINFYGLQGVRATISYNAYRVGNIGRSAKVCNLCRMGGSNRRLSAMRRVLLKWAESHGRRMPWMEDRDPYKVWLAEVVLQQTRVEQGLPYFRKLVRKYPDVFRLAAVQERVFFKDWEGLGYYQRARNLLKAARYIVDQRRGVLPTTYEEWLRLPGVGPYTAAAVMVFAFERPYSVIDSNVARVLARLWNVAGDVSRAPQRQELHVLYEKWRGRHSPSEFAQALLDFGALHCVAIRPNCTSCPLQEYCMAYARNVVHEIPRRRKTSRAHVYFHYLLIEDHRQRVFVTQRKNGTFWSGLYEFPVVESQEDFFDEMGLIRYVEPHAGIRMMLNYTGLERHQVLSHRMVHARLYRLRTMEGMQVQDFIQRIATKGLWADADQLKMLPMSKLMDSYRRWWLGQLTQSL